VLFGAFVSAAIVIAAVATALAQRPKMIVAFDKLEAGKAPAGFSFARTGQGALGKWVVVNDSTAIIGRAIEQSDTDRTDNRFPLAIASGTPSKNVDVVIRFKAVAGQVDRAGGVAVRVQSAENYYIARANALEDNVRFYRVVGGRREQLAGTDIKVPSGEWLTLGLKAEGDTFTTSFNGKVLFSTKDPTFAAAGGVALWTKSDSITRFDQLTITPLD